MRRTHLALVTYVLFFWALAPGCGSTEGGAAVPPLQLRTADGNPPLDYYLYVPPSAGPGAPLFVAVHGTSGNADVHAKRFARLADERGAVVVAPRFSRPRFGDYQRLGRTRMGARADLAFERMLADAARSTGANAARIHLFGYSGGAQFAHRYAMAHPERVAAVVASSAGWYTFPDTELAYPYGIREPVSLPGVGFDPDAFLRVPILVTVGERDGSQQGSFRSNEILAAQQGADRRERAERWAAAMVAAAQARDLTPRVELRTLRGVDHSFSGNMEQADLGELAFGFLFSERRRAATAAATRTTEKP